MENFPKFCWLKMLVKVKKTGNFDFFDSHAKIYQPKICAILKIIFIKQINKKLESFHRLKVLTTRKFFLRSYTTI